MAGARAIQRSIPSPPFCGFLRLRTWFNPRLGGKDNKRSVDSHLIFSSASDSPEKTTRECPRSS